MIDLPLAKEKLDKFVESFEIIDDYKNTELFNKILMEYVCIYVIEKFEREDIAGSFFIEYIYPRSMRLLSIYISTSTNLGFSDYIDSIINKVWEYTKGEWV